MGISIHEAEYTLMLKDIKDSISLWFEREEDLDDAVDNIFDILNNYGAVSWT